MRLLSGPPGSGKTSHTLTQLRAALQARDAGVRLVVPTATMAEHLRHALAREGFVLRPSLIETLAQFIEPWAGLPEAAPAELYLLVEHLAAREFAGAAGTPGFAAALTATIEELSTAGVRVEHLHQGALRQVAREVEAELARRGRALRTARLARAAERIGRSGPGVIHTVWMDGFFALSDPELAVVRAVARHADLTVALPDREALRGFNCEEVHFERRRPQPRREVWRATSPDCEADAIAQRILEDAASGRELHDCGVIVRNPEPYVAALQASFERFGIPARFYFDRPLAEHAVARFFDATAAALESGWDHAATLAAIERAGLAGDDEFDFQVRERLPGRGLADLRALTSGETAKLLDWFMTLDEWRTASIEPAEWAGRWKNAPWPARLVDSAAPVARSQAAALAAFEAALDQAAACMDARRAIPHAKFWRAVSAVARLTPLRVADRRRNVVHVLSVYEARQWELPVVFVCGLIEGQFPRHPVQDPFLPDAARREINRRTGARLATAAEREQEERFLFELATSRATASLVLSYPQADTRGTAFLPSSFLDQPGQETTAWLRPQPRWRPAGRTPGLVAARHTTLSPSALKSYLDCPFQFFVRHTLRLETRPAPPDERLDFLLQGAILHRALAAARRAPDQIEPVFERIFRAACSAARVPLGFRTEALRRQMLDDLRRFLSEAKLPPGEIALTEWGFQLPLAEDLTLRGRVDRIDRTSDGRAVVIDYKRTLPDLNDPNLVQAPLYVMAVERLLGWPAAAMLYCGLRHKQVRVGGWCDARAALGIRAPALTREWLAAAEERAVSAAAEIRAGRIAPRPASLDLCPRCEARDVCRYEGAARALTAEEAG